MKTKGRVLAALLSAAMLMLTPVFAGAAGGSISSPGAVGDFTGITLKDGGLSLLRQGDVTFKELTGTVGGEQVKVANVTTNLRLTQDKLDTILNQKAGTASDKAKPGDYYYTLTANYQEQNQLAYNYVSISVPLGTPLNDKLADAKAEMEKEKGFADSPDVWPLVASLEYNKGDGWKKVGDKKTADGTKSNLQYLLEKLNEGNTGTQLTKSDLAYGKNYRVGVNDFYTIFTYTATNKTLDANGFAGRISDKIYYLKIDYKIQYPVVGKTGSKNVFYPSVEEAIKGQETNIIVNDAVSLGADTILPEGSTLTVAETGTLTLGSNTLTNNGRIVNNGKITGGTIANSGELYTVSGGITSTVTGSEAQPVVDPAVGELATKLKEMGFSVDQQQANTETAVKEQIMDMITLAAQEKGITVTENDVTITQFQPAVAGDASNPNGTDGKFTFNVALQKGMTSAKLEGLIGFVYPTVYVTPPVVEVQQQQGAPKANLVTPPEDVFNAITLTPEERELLTGGAEMSVVLQVGTKPLTDEIKAQIQNFLGDSEAVGMVLDLNLLLKIGDQSRNVTELGKPIRIGFEIPEELKGKGQYWVLRIHNGVVEKLPVTVEDGMGYIETDCFSTYVLTYAEAAAAPAKGDNPRTGDPFSVGFLAITALTALGMGGVASKKRK